MSAYDFFGLWQRHRIREIKNLNSDLFKLAHELSLGFKSAFDIFRHSGGGTIEVFEAALCIRISSLYGHIIMLLQGNSALEAQVLLRALAEAVIILGAISNDESVIASLENNAKTNQRKLYQSIVNKLKGDEGKAAEDVIRNFEEKLASLGAGDGNTIDTATLAKRAGLSNVYDMAFRRFSNESVHTNALSLARHFASSDQEGVTLTMGAEINEIRDTLFVAVGTMLYAYGILIKVTGDETSEQRRTNLTTRLNALAGTEVSKVPAIYGFHFSFKQ